MKVSGTLIIFSSFCVVLGLTGCSMSGEASAAIPGAPAIEIVIPRDAPGEPNIPGEGFAPVLVKVSNFKLADQPGEANIPGEGHIHYYLDRNPQEPSLFSSGRVGESSELFYYWPEIGRGDHSFWAELVNNDHSPLNPRVIASARISTGGYSEG
jgi:hypothetical protein